MLYVLLEYYVSFQSNRDNDGVVDYIPKRAIYRLQPHAYMTYDVCIEYDS